MKISGHPIFTSTKGLKRKNQKEIIDMVNNVIKNSERNKKIE